MRVDWPALMRAGLVGLRLPPAVFWALTPAELMLMLGQVPGGDGMTRARLADLLRAYPDGGQGDD
ncbi:MAG: phage tail assembly chaperone [Roseivivax sp.]|nr:phage tail assembly chaperone [Roseivivax sp.]